MGDAEEEKKVHVEDERWEFLFNYCAKSLKIKMDKWNKMLAVDEYKDNLHKFLNDPNTMNIVFTISPAGILSPTLTYPKNVKNKCVYFIKKESVELTNANISKMLLFGDMSPKPLDELKVLLEELFTPLLTNPENQDGWPQVVIQDLERHMHEFRNDILQVKGAMDNETLLPMPSGAERAYQVEQDFRESGGDEIDMDLRSSIEESIVKWSTIVNNVMKEKSSTGLPEGEPLLPMREVAFWEKRLKTLESIYEQLRDPRVKKMASILELTESVYYPSFKILFRNVVAGVAEARDVVVHLKPLARHFAQLESNDFSECRPYLKPMIHCVCLLWANSRYFCLNSKITLLLREIGNSIVQECTKELDPASIFQGESEEQVKALSGILEILKSFVNMFEEYRNKIETFFADDSEAMPWNFHPRTIFDKLLKFIDRLEKIYEFFLTVIEFGRLEKIEIGGIRGRGISQKVQVVLNEFSKYNAYFGQIAYDPLDPADDSFDKDYDKFLGEVTDLDRKLAALFSQGYDECFNLESIYKYLKVLGGLLHRPIIYEEIEPKLKSIPALMHVELDTTKSLFDDAEKNGIPIDNYMPPVAGSISWINKLRERIVQPMLEFNELTLSVAQGEEADYIRLKYKQMMELLKAKEEQIFNEWTASVADKIKANINKPVLVRDENKIYMNFDPELDSVLREVRYLQFLGIENIPEIATDLYARNEEINNFKIGLKRIEEWYNLLQENCTDVELEMISADMMAIDDMIDELIKLYTWNDDVGNPMNAVYDKIKDVKERVFQAQKNLDSVLDSLKDLGKDYLFNRKNGKLLALDTREDVKNKRYNAIRTIAEDLKHVMEENFALYFNIKEEPVDEEEEEEEQTPIPSPPKPLSPPAKTKGKKGKEKKTKEKKEKARESKVIRPSKDSLQLEEIKLAELLASQEELELKNFRMKRWAEYEAYVDYLVEDLMLFTCGKSLELFMNNMSPEAIEKHVPPLFEILLGLKEPEFDFQPPIDGDADNSLLTTVEDLVNDISYQAELIPRVDSSKMDPHYREKVEMERHFYDDTTETIQRVIQAIETLREYIEIFDPFQYLWTDDKKETLNEFLMYSRKLTAEEKMMLEMDPPQVVKQKKPTIDDFRDKIDFYEAKYEEAEKLPFDQTFDGWLNLNMRPIRQAILNHIRKWGNMFKDHIVNHIITSLDELEDFIKEAGAELSKPIVEDDYKQLVRIITYLNLIKDRQKETDGMFVPIKGFMELLKTYGVKFDDDVHTQLQELPEKWNGLKKLAMNVKQNIANLHAAQCKLILKRAALFEIRQQQFKLKFNELPIFDYDCENPYFHLDKCNKECEELEAVLQKLKDQATLFEVELPEYPEIVEVRRILPLAKKTWDYILIAKSRFDEWKNTLWAKIDVEAMETDCKKMAKELRQFDKEIRSWPIIEALDAEVKNMLTSLKAVTELQNPAIRDRHWMQLQQVTQVKIEMTPQTTLSDLLDLELHKFEEDVKNTVDQAVKEQAMEKALKDINNNWSTMELSYDYMDKTKCNVVRPSEEIVELLEDNQVQIQNMLNSKYIPYFFDEVSEWQKKLSTSDQVNSLWFEVQRKWMYLESIFVGSDDIRQQLPSESKKFDVINNTFRTDLLANITKTPNFVKATNAPGLYDKLETLNADLIVCEKALNDYLETKRLTYPRFYFISSADLLDILSNGNSPELVQKHLTKLYDSLAKLNFIKVDKKNTKDADGMFAKDGEYIPMVGKIECSGKVEIWLNRLTDIMRVTIMHYIHDSVFAYEDKPRDQWLFDWPAQPALVATQIWWATEVNLSFFRMEEGFENAMKDFSKKQIQQLNNLIVLLLGDLTEGDRQKIMTVCTIDVHSRDVVTKMIAEKVETGGAFQWQSQLRHRWEDESFHCFANICDAQFRFDYEYLGNTPRLVITPLTDRCYITLTQSLHLIMGGAPAGPAGTGKTETTKDLGKALGIMVYVFNCSEQMDYKSCANIYKGLAQTGAWGCFDEFNRIAVEVLSVIAVQVKTILDAIKFKKKIFYFYGNDIILVPTVGMFITMNPGYAGRAELPENLKTLFRPCAMVVPDFALISEIMLVAEGFQEARLLSRKFITLYTLCRELLSKQDHYDWGLRAIKSVLVVAGSLKRADRQRPEDQVLMRALRDFNIPKIVTDDVPIFMGLIGDLFPALDVPRKRDLEFEGQIKKAAVDLLLQPEDGFILKIVQLKELFAVRHSVFIIGLAGTGKSEVWRTLYKTYQNLKLKPHYNDLNPKTVTNDELFGIINPATREWKDGIVSVLIREQSQMPGIGPKWLVLDGDIDPMWIESLNTVMDDNKVLTLASNERIALTPQMRLLFEISNLRTATPATVSRAGILYINPADLGWNPFVATWIETRETPAEKAQLVILFDKYVNPCLEVLKTKMKKITPIPECAHLEMLCFLLESLLVPANVPKECPREWYEIYFVFASVWAFGSSMFQDQLVDWRNEFHKWWINEFKTVRFPTQNTIFDYYVDQETKKFLPWSNRVKKFELDPDLPLSITLVDTSETSRYRYFMDLLLPIKAPVMLIGSAGTGKSVIISEKLGSLPENYLICNVPFNFYTTSEMLQRVLEKPLVKKAGRNYGPPGTKIMIYFIDDLNMPEVDNYGTVQPHTLIRQHMDYEHWYDRVKIQLKEIHNVQYVACMNPTAGSFTIDPRLQRHFCVFAVSFPRSDALMRIYTEILHQHLTTPTNKYLPSVSEDVEKVIAIVLETHKKVTDSFLPTAVRFHYIFNIRDLSNIFQGILFTTGDCIKTVSDLLRVYMHEATRVYCDKLIDAEDIKSFARIVSDCIKKGEVEDISEATIFADPLIYCHFAEGIGDPKYLPIRDWPQLSKLLNEALSNYNELIASMNLVLFEDAMYHLCRINRIMEAPRGNALLIGVGGSGKQSLSRLAASISSLEVFQIQLRKGYSIADLKADFSVLYTKAGVKSVGIVFLMTDSQVADEKFLVVINDILATGEIPELFPDDDVENIISAMRNEVKIAGIPDTRENCWKFFIDRVRKTMKVTLCFSPVGSTLRIRGRKFPALVNCTSIDWFHEWPQDALESVSKRFLSELSCLPENLVESVSLYMSYVHTVVNQMSQIYLTNERRYNYTTPKSFLEQIELYSKLLTKNINNVNERIFRLTNGLEKLRVTAGEVAGLKEKLGSQEIELIAKNKAAEDLIKIVSEENEKVGKEKDFAANEEKKVRIIEEDVTKKAKACAEDLRKAEPALVAAQEALNTLNKNNLTELKSFGAPPDLIKQVCGAVMILQSNKTGKIPKDVTDWKVAKNMMAKVDKFLDSLINYDKEGIKPEIVKAIQPFLKNPEFDPDIVLAKSAAASGLCAWVINIMRFHDVYVVVEPKRKALAKANQELKDAQSKLLELKLKLEQLEEQLGELKSQFDAAVEAKIKCQQEADATALTIDLANRLVNGLASENIRWKSSVVSLKESIITLPGDILQVTAFISYVGCFTRKYRSDLLVKYWEPFLDRLQPAIPKTGDLDPLSLLTDDAQIAQWNNEGLPSDRMSTENATILTNSSRWPLMIDPQLQGIKWIKTKYGDDLIILRLTARNYLDKLERAIENGDVVLLENIGETVDAVLDPLLGRLLIKKGKVLKMGDKEVDYNEKFRLILHTKLANPHYRPEMQAQCTLINFTVTKDGLEEQLLAEVVKAERPDLELLKSELTKQNNNFKITLKSCEDNLLSRLSSASGNILGDVALVENLETTKKTAAEIGIKVEEAKITTVQIDEAREAYRPAGARSSLLYFVLNDLQRINPIYQFSLKAFSVVFARAIENAVPEENVMERVNNLIDSITFSVFLYTNRSLFERDKLIFLSHMSIQILASNKECPGDELDFLFRMPITPINVSPLDFLSTSAWGAVKSLSNLNEFMGLDKDIEGSFKRWRKFVNSDTPETEKFPSEWKNKTPLQQLCMMRALRPDRITYAVKVFIEIKIGRKFIETHIIPFPKSYQEASSITPVFFILSAGVDPTKDVESLGRQLGFSIDNQNFHNVSLGQGQEEVAEGAMDLASREGHWVILQNIHLVERWLPTLDKKMEQVMEGAHEDYRLFISAEPAADPAYNKLPQGVLESSIKITNEPPTGMAPNLHAALNQFTEDTLEMSSKDTEFRVILFSLCYFHAVVAERRKFGAQGWNRVYPFNVGDLTICVYVLYNYLEINPKVPWEDLRYLFGEIMYGGHITDDWDRKLCRTFLQEYMSSELIDSEVFLAPGFNAPPTLDYMGYHKYIDENLPAETPYLYGLHPNAEIGFLTTVGEVLFKTLFELQPRDAGASTQTVSREDKIKGMLEEFLDKLPDLYNMTELYAKVEELTPYTIVAFQECERMNNLVNAMKTQLKEVELGLKGELTITKAMEDLQECLFMDVVPASWEKLAYPSLLPLGGWFQDLTVRMSELSNWTSDFSLPATIWLAGFFNPQSLLTAIMQQTARKNEWPLDRMCLNCDVTKRQREDFTAAPREGAYICGLIMEGARWDINSGSIVESIMKDLFPQMPVVFIRAVTQDKQDVKNVYECPVYKTRTRGPTYVWTFNLRTKSRAAKWILAGVALILQI